MIPGKQYRPEDFVEIAWRYKWLILLPFVVAAAATAAYTARLPDLYRSETWIMFVPPRLQVDLGRATRESSSGNRLQSVTQQVMSRARLERLILDLDLYPNERRTSIMEDVVEQFRRDIVVSSRRGDTFSVGYLSRDPRKAQQVAERLGSMFIDENLRQREMLSEGTDQFLESQLEETRLRLEERERRLSEYRQANRGELPDQVNANIQVLQRAETQLRALAESVNRDRDRRLVLERQLAELADPVVAPLTLSAEPGEITGRTAAEQLEAARASLRAMELRFKPEHPDILRMNRLVAELERKAEAEAFAQPLSAGGTALTPADVARRKKSADIQAEIGQIDKQTAQKQAEEQRLRGVVAEYEARLQAAPTRQTELIGLTRDYGSIQSVYQNLLSKREEAKLASSVEQRQVGAQFSVVEPARVPQRPFSPNRQRLNLMGAAAGLGLGLLLSALLEYRDKTLRKEDDVLSALALPVLGLVPQMLSRHDRRVRRRRRLLVSTAGAVLAVVAVAGAVWKFGPW